jgi:hypothetical protein
VVGVVWDEGALGGYEGLGGRALGWCRFRIDIYGMGVSQVWREWWLLSRGNIHGRDSWIVVMAGILAGVVEIGKACTKDDQSDMREQTLVVRFRKQCRAYW